MQHRPSFSSAVGDSTGNLAATAKSHSAGRCDQLSRWAMRKSIAKSAKDNTLRYVMYLQKLLDTNETSYANFQSFKLHGEYNNYPICLERYTEISNVGNTSTSDNTSVSASIGLHTGHHAVVSAPELRGRAETLQQSVEAVSDDCPSDVHDKYNPLQCRVCKSVFESRNTLFQHLEDVCLHGELQRSGADDTAHRRRWKARARLGRHNAGRGGLPTVVCEVQPSGGDVAKVIEIPEKASGKGRTAGTSKVDPVVCIRKDVVEPRVSPPGGSESILAKVWKKTEHFLKSADDWRIGLGVRSTNWNPPLYGYVTGDPPPKDKAWRWQVRWGDDGASVWPVRFAGTVSWLLPGEDDWEIEVQAP